MLNIEAIFAEADVIVWKPVAKTNSQQAIRSDATATDDPRVVDTANALGATLGDDWIERPDVNGKMGWERAGLPESMRWWARRTFEELPK